MISPRHLILACLLLLCPGLASAVALERGHIFYQSTFDSLDGWSAGGRLDDEGTLCIDQAKPAGTVNLSHALPIHAMRGAVVYFSVRVKARDISDKPNPWNGVKIMAVMETPAGKRWPQVELPTGSFDWQTARFVVRVPPDATSLTLVLGLEQVTGRAWFDDVRVVLGRAANPQAVAPRMPGQDDKPFTGRAEDRLRGVMISPNISADALRTLGATWNANLIRWQLIHTGAYGKPPPALADYDAWLERELARLDAALPLCKQLGLRVVIDIHSPPGGRAVSGGYIAATGDFFTDPAAQAKFLDVWRRIATRYKDEPAIWGYDLVNEPVDDQTAENCDDWQTLAARAAKIVRAIDGVHAIIVEPPAWGSAGGFIGFEPIDVPGVVYSFHFYEPGQFTHQRLRQDGPGVDYPGQIAGAYWDRAALERAMKPAIDFQKKYNVHLYVGEFSAIRWAPNHSAYRYLKDCVDIFESHGWDWSYHAFREFNGWSVEHGEDRSDTSPAREPTDREQLVRAAFARNRKAG
jgi:hypothetical protein